MIIYGTRGRRSLKDTGNFFCPKCQATRSYRHHAVTRWFTLYFIPLIPLGVHGEYVECGYCRTTWDPEVKTLTAQMEQEREEFLAEFQKGMRDIMVLMMLADGRIEPLEREIIRSTYAQLASVEYSDEALTMDVARLGSSEVDVGSCARSLSGLLNVEGKMMVLQSAALVAGVDGEIVDAEHGVLQKLTKELELDAAALPTVLEQLGKSAG